MVAHNNTVNITDSMRQADDIQIKENNPRQPKTEDEKKLVDKIQQQAQAVAAGVDPLNLTDEQLEDMGITSDQLRTQMEYYQEQQKKQEANAVLGRIYQMLDAEEDYEVPDMRLYDELLDYLLNHITEVMDRYTAEAYKELCSFVKNAMEKEKTDPYVKPGDREEDKAMPIKEDFFDNDKEGTEYFELNKELKTVLEQNKDNITTTWIAKKILDFTIMTAVIGVNKEDAKNLAEIIGIYDMLQAISLGKVNSDIINTIMNRTTSIEEDDQVRDILLTLFPSAKIVICQEDA